MTIPIVKKATAPVIEISQEAVFVPPESVELKNVSRNIIYGLDGAVKPGETGRFTFADYCNLSPVYLEKV